MHRNSENVTNESFISAEQTWTLRHQILRPHQSLHECKYPLDDDPLSVHVGVTKNEQLVGIGSAFPEDRNSGHSLSTYRLRGMAVAPDLQGQGLGSIVLSQIVQTLEARQAKELWCNARSTATQFYERHGFRVVGKEFGIAGLGLHFLLVKPLSAI